MTLGIAVIGLGFMGQTHVRAFQSAGPDARLAAVYDLDPARLTGRGGAGGNIKTGSADADLFNPAEVFTTTSLEALLARPDIDVVSVCTPTDTHARVAAAALRAGKHVLVEKPVSLDRAEIESLAGLARETGLVCMPAMCIRFWPAWSWLASAIGSGAQGRLQSLWLERVGAAPAWGGGFYQDDARSGGALYDLHIHDTDFVCGTLGLPDAVTTVGERARMTTIYHYDRGPAHVVAAGGWLRGGPAYRMRYLAEFESATADFDHSADPVLRLARDGVSTPVIVEPGTGYEHEARAFVATIRDGTPPPVTLDDAARTALVLEAEARSMRSSRRERVMA